MNIRKIIGIGLTVVACVCLLVSCSCDGKNGNETQTDINGTGVTNASNGAQNNHTEEYLPDVTFNQDEKNLDWGDDWGGYENVTDANGKVIGTRTVPPANGNSNSVWGDNNAVGNRVTRTDKNGNVITSPPTTTAKPTEPQKPYTASNDKPIVLPDVVS